MTDRLRQLLSELEPPPSAAKIEQFSQNIVARSSAYTSGASVWARQLNQFGVARGAVGQAGFQASQFSSKLNDARMIGLGPASFAMDFSMPVGEMREFMSWLSRRNERLNTFATAWESDFTRETTEAISRLPLAKESVEPAVASSSDYQTQPSRPSAGQALKPDPSSPTASNPAESATLNSQDRTVTVAPEKALTSSKVDAASRLGAAQGAKPWWQARSMRLESVAEKLVRYQSPGLVYLGGRETGRLEGLNLPQRLIGNPIYGVPPPDLDISARRLSPRFQPSKPDFILPAQPGPRAVDQLSAPTTELREVVREPARPDLVSPQPLPPRDLPAPDRRMDSRPEPPQLPDLDDYDGPTALPHRTGMDSILLILAGMSLPALSSFVAGIFKRSSGLGGTSIVKPMASPIFSLLGGREPSLANFGQPGNIVEGTPGLPLASQSPRLVGWGAESFRRAPWSPMSAATSTSYLSSSFGGSPTQEPWAPSSYGQLPELQNRTRATPINRFQSESPVFRARSLFASPLDQGSFTSGASLWGPVNGGFIPSSDFQGPVPLRTGGLNTLSPELNLLASPSQIQSGGSIGSESRVVQSPATFSSQIQAKIKPIVFGSLLGAKVSSIARSVPQPGSSNAAMPSVSSTPISKIPIDPLLGQITIISSPLDVGSGESDSDSVAVRFGMKSLAGGGQPLDASSLSSLKANLPPGAQAIYPAVSLGSLGASAVNLPMAGSLVSQIHKSAFPDAHPDLANQAASAARGLSVSAPAAPLSGSIVPKFRPIGSPASLFGSANESGAGALTAAGGGSATRSGPLSFMGLPVRLAPSLSGRSELVQEQVARAPMGQTSGGTIKSQSFGALQQKLFPQFKTIDAEPDQDAWRKAAPSFGLRSGDPISVLAPDSRVRFASQNEPMRSVASAFGGSRGIPSHGKSTSPNAQTSGRASGITDRGPGIGLASRSPASVGRLGTQSGSAPRVGRPLSHATDNPARGGGTDGWPLLGNRPSTFASLRPGSGSMPTSSAGHHSTADEGFNLSAGSPIHSASSLTGTHHDLASAFSPIGKRFPTTGFPSTSRNLGERLDSDLEPELTPQSVRSLFGTFKNSRTRGGLPPVGSHSVGRFGTTNAAKMSMPVSNRDISSATRSMPRSSGAGLTLVHREQKTKKPPLETVIQRSTGIGATPAASGQTSPRGMTPPQTKPNDSADVDAMALEVWHVLKRRLKNEAERRGQW